VVSRFYVLTNRRKLDAFLAAGNKLDDLAVSVGILSGKPKYPPGHVGRRSREKRTGWHHKIDQEELTRRAYIRQGRAQLSTIKDPIFKKQKLKELRAQLKEHHLSSRGLARAVTAGTAVARVAGVIQGRTGAGMHSSYHQEAKRQHKVKADVDLQNVMRAMLRGQPPAPHLQKFGRGYRDAIRAALAATRHTDTGKLYRNTQYEITSKSQAAAWKAKQKADRAARRAAKGRR
jgi:hypothetical protein